MKDRAKRVIVYLDKKYNHDWDKIFKAIKNKEPIDKEDLEKTDIDDVLTLVDKGYPAEYRDPSCDKPPFVIYKKHICCICGEEFSSYGNNPEGAVWKTESGKIVRPKFNPGDRCCDKCNHNIVISGRIYLKKHPETEETEKYEYVNY